MPTEADLPQWDLTPFFPGVDSPELDEEIAKTVTDIQDFKILFDRVSTVDTNCASEMQQVLEGYGAIAERFGIAAGYLGLIVSADSNDSAAQAKLSAFEQSAVELGKLRVRIAAWTADWNMDEVLIQSPKLREYEYLLKTMQTQARHLMPPAEEELAAELHITGGRAWAKLHGDLTSQITVNVPLPDGEQGIPMSAVRNLAFDADREVRRHAYEAELAAWERHQIPLAAAMNSIKGQVNTLSRRRGWQLPLAESLFENGIDRESLEAMLSAARDAYPDFHRYLNAKARVLGVEKLAWYDLFAPLSTNEKAWEWPEAERFIVDSFATYSAKLSDFAARAFRERWIDAEPRPGKRDGAFCAGIWRDQSRILANFKPSFGGVSTLAHELGHGYHNLCLSVKPIMLRSAAMTLAETASIFCETIIRRAGLEASGEAAQLAILEASLQGACQIVVDIPSRFQFEQNLFEARLPRELSSGEMNALMLQAQEETYGDGLDPDLRHPYMWAMKPHYYSESSYYNYPYMFGMLFALGLYARYQAAPEEFTKQYDSLLSSTGCADAAALANRFGIDIRTEEFWTASLDIVREDIRRFERLSTKIAWT